MSFNIRNINGEPISNIRKDVRNTTDQIDNGLAPGTSKDISNGINAEDSRGRATFSMMNKTPQYQLRERFNKLSKEFPNEMYISKELENSCTINNELNEELLDVTEEFIQLSKTKPEKQQCNWDTLFPQIIKTLRNKDGSINPDIYNSAKTLLKDPQIATKGINDILQACKEYGQNEKGESVQRFNKNIFDDYPNVMNLNKIMHEQDDVFTLYLGRTLKGCSLKGEWLREGQENIVDHVAWNFAKRLYQQKQDIVHMDRYLENFHKCIQENGQKVVSGFEFKPITNGGWATKMIEDLKKSCGEEIAEKCKVNGEDSLHNLLVANTLGQETSMSYWDIKHIIDKFKNEDGIVPTNFVSYICREGKNATSSTAYDLQKCLNKNGSVNEFAWNKVRNGKIYTGCLEDCRVDGEINFENLEILETLTNKMRTTEKYENYHIHNVFKELKNKNGVVDKSILEPLDELMQMTHLAPDELKDCLDAKGELDKALFELKKQVVRKNGSYATKIPEICKNADGSANQQGIDAYKTMLNSGLNNNQIVINTFSTEEQCDLEALKDFSREFASIDKKYSHKILDMSIIDNEQTEKEVIDLNRFRTLKEAISNPEIAALMEDLANTNVVKAKFEPFTINSKDFFQDGLYDFEHLKEKDIEILEKYGYPARFCKAIGAEKKYFVDTPSNILRNFEQDFILSSTLENRLKAIELQGDMSLSYTTEQLTADIKKSIENLPEKEKDTLTKAFRLEFGENGIEGFPQRFEEGTTPPTGMEEAFTSINTAINRFYSSSIKTERPDLAGISEEISAGFPEFKMLISKTDKNGERVDIKTLKQLKTLISDTEYQALSTEDKAVAKMTVLLNNLEHINSKPSTVTKKYTTNNDETTIHINANWKKQAEYANSILERYNLSEQAKYRIIQLINDIGWSKELEAGTLTSFDIAVNQRYKGDEVVSPLVERIVGGECKFDKSAVAKEAKNLHKNQQLFMSPTMAELEPYIQTTKIHGQELRYVDLDRPELRDKAFLSHFLGYDNNDHTLNLLKNKAYRSTYSASIVRGGEHSSCFASRNTGIVFESDNVNVAHTYHTNIDSGFGKQYDHLKTVLKKGGAQDIKETMKKILNLNNEEYGQLMEQTVHSTKETLPDVIINGRKISKEEIKKAYDKGIENILSSKDQNETTILNPRPFAIIGIGDSIDSHEVSNAVGMAQANDMLLLFKRKH